MPFFLWRGSAEGHAVSRSSSRLLFIWIRFFPNSARQPLFGLPFCFFSPLIDDFRRLDRGFHLGTTATARSVLFRLNSGEISPRFDGSGRLGCFSSTASSTQKEAKKILLLGLDNARNDDAAPYVPPLAQHQPTSEELSIGKIQFNAFDLVSLRHTKTELFWGCFARFGEWSFCNTAACSNLHFYKQNDSKPRQNRLSTLANIPFLLLGNKIDIPYAESEEELCFPSRPEQVHNRKGKGQPCGL
uniref:Uncharacterized protein n=1 Tax=Musa acuminata subsp. malaccensis TaxID=214687 RepID=A0A804L8K3_MUSAM